jgi:mono/diheme cytochrome c family protein
MRAHLGWVLLVVLGTAFTGWAWAQQGAPKVQLSQEAKSVMRPRMKQHGPDMERLIWSVVLLQRGQTRVLAERLAGAERLARPLPNQLDTINAAVPELFFTLQDQLHDRAGDLQAAAARGDDDAVAAAFGKMAETCVACHARYLQ